MMQKQANIYSWLLSLTVVFALTLPFLIQDGMFMDAMLYTSVAKNLAEGYGTFWFPQFSKYNIAGLSSFHEQPPLGFGIQSLFFTVLGSSLYTERIYVLCTILLTVYLIFKIWKLVAKDTAYENSGWVVPVLWISIPVCFSTYRDNMMEDTMTIFILLSAFFFLLYRQRNKLIYAILTGVSIFCAALVKGVPGFFPLILPLLYHVFIERSKLLNLMRDLMITGITVLLLFGLLMLWPDARESLSVYLFKRLLVRVNDVPTVTNQFYIFYRLLSELLVPVALVLIFFLFERKDFKQKWSLLPKQYVYFFLCLGIAGSLPLMLTKVQKGFYFVPSLPFFAIAFGLVVAPIIAMRLERQDFNKYMKWFKPFTLILFVTVLLFTVSKAGQTRRHKDVLHDVYIIGKYIPGKTLLSVEMEIMENWAFQTYMMRYFTVSLEPYKKEQFYLVLKGNANGTDIQGFQKVNTPLILFDLYQKE